ncbi:hypothetical protein D3C77_527450 [compost metagenome]
MALVRDAVFVQYLIDDVRHRQEMEDPAVLFQAQYPDIRADHRLIVGAAKTAFPLSQAGNQPRDRALFLATDGDGQRPRLQQLCFQFDV